MPEVDRAVGQSAGAREADVVGAQHLEHLGAHQALDQRHLKEAQRDRGQDQRFQPGGRQQARAPPADQHGVAAAEGRQPAELYREDQDQQDADQEGRQRHADERYREEHVRKP